MRYILNIALYPILCPSDHQKHKTDSTQDKTTNTLRLRFVFYYGACNANRKICVVSGAYLVCIIQPWVRLNFVLPPSHVLLSKETANKRYVTPSAENESQSKKRILKLHEDVWNRMTIALTIELMHIYLSIQIVIFRSFSLFLKCGAYTYVNNWSDIALPHPLQFNLNITFCCYSKHFPPLTPHILTEDIF